MQFDPRTKLVAIICITTLAVLYNTPGPLFLLLIASMILLLFFRIDPRRTWGYLRPFLYLFLLLFVIQVIFSPGGEVLLAVRQVPLITGRGLDMGASVVLRLLVVITVAVLLTTASSRDIVLGLVQLRIPYEVAFMVEVAMRFLPVFREELANVVTAVQLRGVDLQRVPWGQKMALYRSLLFPVVYGALLKAQQLSEAMDARGFRAYPRRTYLRRLQFQSLDYAMMLLFLAGTSVLVWRQLV
ncbi:MAG: energy-coupling factor transporter transmembrane component T [Thermacetogeniaceae bacterium]